VRTSMTVGEDLDGGGGARGGGAGTRREPRRRVHGWRGPRWRARWWRGPRRWRRSVWRQCGGGRCGTEEERSTRHRRGRGRRNVEAHVEEEQSVRRQRGGGRGGGASASGCVAGK
jgi:hypothetical protein